jgi:hypothetical protein
MLLFQPQARAKAITHQELREGNKAHPQAVKHSLEAKK